MPRPQKSRNHGSASLSQLRIIGGEWRGRKLGFTAAEGLRPTTDRVRETLFNWLMPELRGARCLDLFSGSGALGLEALSRGAAHCDFVDTNNASLRQIKAHLGLLGADQRGVCHSLSAGDFLAQNERRWDVVFVDPPFGQALAEPACAQLAVGRLSPGASVYLEFARQEAAPAVPEDWQLHRDKTAGNVRYRLYYSGT